MSPSIRQPHVHLLGQAFLEHRPWPRPQTGPSGQQRHLQAYPCPSGSWLYGTSRGGGSRREDSGTSGCQWNQMPGDQVAVLW